MTDSELAALCLHLPGVREDIKWGNYRVFSVADNKMFALIDVHDHSCSLKVADDLFLGYCDRPGVSPAPYLARAHWVTLSYPYPLPEAELCQWLKEAHQLVVRKLPKRRQIGLLLD